MSNSFELDDSNNTSCIGITADGFVSYSSGNCASGDCTVDTTVIR